MNDAACALVVAVVLVVTVVTCGRAAGNEGFGTTHEIVGAVVDICWSVVVSAANTGG